MGRLIVVSNHVHLSSEQEDDDQEGLAVALAAALRSTSGMWFGWSGRVTERFSGQIDLQRRDGITTALVDLEAQDADEYFGGFANRTLWPLFHYRVDLAEHERGYACGYHRVNERFAETMMPMVASDDLIWVHDYHLIPLGAELRRRGCRNRIGFFLHTPWPPRRLLTSLPGHRSLVEAMFDYDLIGFQTHDWLDSFVHYVREELGARVDADGMIDLDGRSVRAIVCPMGIDTAAFGEAACDEAARQRQESLARSCEGRTMIIGVDRLDQAKGIEERFRGYERLLARRPDLQGRLFFLQVTPPPQGDVGGHREIRARLDTLSGHINGAFATAEWAPLRYVNKGYARETLADMYRAARVGFVTPLCDGMNLVAKEYVAAQDPDDPGVLILSHFAGAAAQLKQALLVNPHSPEEVADALERAIAMPRAERLARWRALMDNVESEDVNWWLQHFLYALDPPTLASPDCPGGENDLATAS